ncbi:CobW family GTP-binding protein [Gordonia sp. NPDC003429]
MRRSSIPVVVIAGFLGAGKTTLLNHLLRVGGRSGRARLGVLVNDFGSVNVDALLIAGQVDGATSLANGCMCCAVDRDGLDSALSALLRPSAGLDAVVIEASGIAEPKALIRMISSARHPRMHYGGLVYLVDAAQFGTMRRRHPEIDGHVAVADLVVINKRDLVDEVTLRDVKSVVGEINPTAPVLTVNDAAIDPDVLFDRVDSPEAADTGPRQLTLDELMADDHDTDHHDSDPHDHDWAVDDDHRHLHERYQSVELSTDAAADPRRLAELLQRPPAGCYRIKGVVWFDLPGSRGRFSVHGVGGFVRVHREPRGTAPPHTDVVLIGVDMDTAAARGALDAVIATEATAADEHGILHITRHLPQG